MSIVCDPIHEIYIIKRIRVPVMIIRNNSGILTAFFDWRKYIEPVTCFDL